MLPHWTVTNDISGIMRLRMPPLLLLAGVILALSIPGAASESAELRFLGQTQFVVNESSGAVVRLVVERVGDPVNVTALVLLEGDDTGDFVATTAAAFLLSSENNKTIFIAVRDDDLPEADETFTFNLKLQSSSNGVRLGTPNKATITILSNDNAFGIIAFNSTDEISVDEPRNGSHLVPLTLVREKGTYGAVTVYFEVSGGPNPAIEDLSPDRGNITIPPGTAVVVFSILIQNDQIPEDDEVFWVRLTGAAGGALLRPNGSSVPLRIRRNDSPLRFSQATLVVPETAGVIALTVTRGRLTEGGPLIGSNDTEVSVDYVVVSGDGAASATPAVDFADLQAVRTLTFPAFAYRARLLFNVSDDDVPEIAESFHVVLLEESVRGDAVLVAPSAALVTIEPNDKPHGVLSIVGGTQVLPVSINEDVTQRWAAPDIVIRCFSVRMLKKKVHCKKGVSENKIKTLDLRFEGISVVRNGGNYGQVSVNWTIGRNSTSRAPVSDDLTPAAGTLLFAAGQSEAVLPLDIVPDDLPEEAEAFLLRLLPDTVTGGAEVDEPMEMVFYIQDSDDVYGTFGFHPREAQSIQSHLDGRFLSLSFLRQGGTLGEVSLALTALYIPAGPVDPRLARDRVLNVSRSVDLRFADGQDEAALVLPIRNDAFLQNGAHFLIQLDAVELVDIRPPIPSVSPRFGGSVNLTLTVTPDIANGEIGFTSNTTLVVIEPEDANATTVSLPLRRDGTDGQAEVFWSLQPVGAARDDVTAADLRPFSGSVVFLSGQSDALINLTIMADEIPEVNETLLLSLDRVETARFVVFFGSNVENQVLKAGFTSREIVILENDDPGGVFEFARGPWVINEGEAVELRVLRSQGRLLKQLVRYTVVPHGGSEFYGAEGILEFKPGEREVVVALVAQADGVPELDETFSVVLSSHSTPPSRIGNHREVNITVRQNDDPFGVIEFSQSGLAEAINESKGNVTHQAAYPVMRNRGRFGAVSVSWLLDPGGSGDVRPTRGVLVFQEGEFIKNLTVASVPDEIPEATENFTLTLMNVTGGARLGSVLNASLQVNKNDDPIYFADPFVVRVEEGGVANFTVIRGGRADFVATVMYRVVYGDASPTDLALLGDDAVLVYDVGEWMKNISVAVEDDDEPETDEPFHILLFDATGDAVVYGADTATVVIEANDDANGIFSLDPTEKAVEEGGANNFYVRRARGHFGDVSVFWRLYANDSLTPLEENQEFANTSGAVAFATAEQSKPIVLEAISDKLPEFNEFYVLRLVNISGGHPGGGGRLANASLNATVLIPFNDDPFGVFAIADDDLDQEVAEDVLSGEDMSDVASFAVLRRQGAFGDVRVAWEILSARFPKGLPPMDDLLLAASFPAEVALRPRDRRRHAATDARFFSGAPGAYGTVAAGDAPAPLGNFTFSAWVAPAPDTDGFVASKGERGGGGALYYGVKVHTNQSHVSVMLYYTAAGANRTRVARATAEKFAEDNVWLHVLITADDGVVEFYLDGSPIPGGLRSIKGEGIADGPAPVFVGSDPDGGQRFTGLLQDVRVYAAKLDHGQVRELHAQPAKADLRTVSGYLRYRQEERNKSFVVEVRDDDEEEGEEVFYLQLVAAHGGARLPLPRPTAVLRVMKSDNANGLFGLCIQSQLKLLVNPPCFLLLLFPSSSSSSSSSCSQTSDEGSTISCVIERTRGALDVVYVNYSVTETGLSGGQGPAGQQDFANATGAVLFMPGQRSEVLNLLVLDDDLPELAESFQVTLVAAESGDGKPGSTPTSGASIDHNSSTNPITVTASDHPYARLFEPAHVTVSEEDGEVRLMVARAQGLLGRVTVGYRTTPFMASSPEDYEDTEGILDFLPGERLKFITVTIVDNPVPELDKSFRVELFNADGGVDQFLRSEGSGSGESDSDLLLPAYHRANLGVAAHITVTIAASDDAHGVFQLSPDSLAVNGTEPEDGRSAVLLQVDRSFGDLSNVTVYWEAEPSAEGELLSRSGNVTFGVGQSSESFFIRVAQDEVPELDRSFDVTLVNVSHGRLGERVTATLTVLASDDPYGVFVFANATRSLRLPEGDSTVVLTIRRQKGLMGKVRVTYETLREADPAPYRTPGVGRASEGRDFVPLLDSVVFLPNQSEANISLQILDDEDPERDESVFVELTGVDILEAAQERLTADSPRLGPRAEAVAQVVVEASDDAFGTLQLSVSAVGVAEDYVGPIINVTRTGGIFADVSVKFRAVPITATVSEDYSVASTDVVLLEGESSKAVPVYIINDRVPELEESFLLELINQTTGGALLGDLTRAIITILPSDDPFGAFVFQAAPVTLEEPESGSIEVTLPIVRKAGTIGTVAVQWRASVNGQLAVGDIRPASGEVSFAPGETKKTLRVEVLADDIIKVELTGASNGGSLGRETSVNIIVPANDNPYGTVFFDQAVYRIQEPLDGIYMANITVRRSGGSFGRMAILYSTSEVDLVGVAQADGQDLLLYYDPPLPGALPSAGGEFNITGALDPLAACAAACLREPTCQAFSLATGPPASCSWVTSWTEGAVTPAQANTYGRNATAVAVLLSGRAVPGSDYTAVTAHRGFMEDGWATANLSVPILTDKLPEIDESFAIEILKIELLNLTVAERNRPSIGQPSRAVVTIAMNGDSFGVFLMYSLSPNATEEGLRLVLREEPRTVPLVIERRGGSMGRVTVEWRFVGGGATLGEDFTANGGTLIFADGDVRKTVEVVIRDDSIPEDSESLMIALVHTEGGSRILPSSDTVTIVILANDHVAGIVGFHPASRAVATREGEQLSLLVMRTAPGLGNVTVDWAVDGPLVDRTFPQTSGTLFFTQGELNDTIVLQLLDDATPEDKDEYRVALSNIRTFGVEATGHAALDIQGAEAVVTIETSDEPFGMLSIAASSLRVTTEERDRTLNVYVNREFGTSGAVNITYEVIAGALSDLTQVDGALAEPDEDFVSATGSVVLQPGQTSVAIPVTILDDDIPELQEYFLVNITSAVLITTLATAPRLDTNGLLAEISILANDGIRGVIGWTNTMFEVNETQGVLSLVAYRNRGTYGNVSLSIHAPDLEAQQGLDYNISQTMLHFVDGERHKFVEVQIIDDITPEGPERFQLILSKPSPGLELGTNTTATVNILASDDGHGVLSFNGSERVLLKEPTSTSAPGESVATLAVVRSPEEGTFGTVTVQFSITDANGSLAEGDLRPAQGSVVLENGVRFKTLEIWAILDAEPEANETFTVSLSSPTGGARLGEQLQTFITILENLAPSGLFRIGPSLNRTNSEVVAHEGGTPVFLTVSRSNGLESAVSVEWETQADTAIGAEGYLPVMGVYQDFEDHPTSAWCSVPEEASSLAMRLDRTPSAASPHTLATLYRWQGVFVPIQSVRIQEPSSCVGFVVNGSTFIAITHGGPPFDPAANLSIFRLQLDLNITLEQTLGVEALDVKHFRVESRDYLIASSQVFVRVGEFFTLLQTLDLPRDIVSVSSLFSHFASSSFHLVTCVDMPSDGCFVHRWAGGSFLSDPQPLALQSRARQVEVIRTNAGVTLLFVVVEDRIPSCEVFMWTSGQSQPELVQSLLHPELASIHPFTPRSGTTYVLLAGSNSSSLYSWRPEVGHFSLVLRAPPALSFLSLAVTSLSASRTLLASTGDTGGSTLYWFTSVSNQSDFIPSYGELHFAPGDSELEIAVNVLDDDIPEREEYFRVALKNPKGGAEIGFGGQVTVVIPTNDDAHGVIGFAQESLYMEVEELEQNNLISLSVERRRGTFGRLTVHWAANGSLTDIFPTSGVVLFSEGQSVADITLSVVADGVAEVSEHVTVTLMDVTTVGLEEPLQAATIDARRAHALLTILANGSPYGVIGWHMDSLFTGTQEPARSPVNVSLSIVREQGSSGDVAVRYQTKPALSQPPANQASAGLDYLARDDTVVMVDGATVVLVTFTIMPDDVPELAERFLVNISGVELVGGSTGPGRPSLKRPGMEVAEVTIEENDDPRGILQFNVSEDAPGRVLAYEIAPPDNVFRLSVARLAGTTGRVVIYWAAQPNTAGFDDFSPSSGNVTLKDGQRDATIDITIIDDDEGEPEETFTVSLLRVIGGARLGKVTSVTASIPANDSPLGRFGFQNQEITVSEPEFTDDPAAVATLVVLRSTGGQGAVTLAWQLEDLARGDLSPLNGNLVFAATESTKSFVIRALADSVLEGDESFTVRLLPGTSDAVVDPLTGLATITIQADRAALGVVGVEESSRDVFIGEPERGYNGSAVVRLVRGPGVFGEIQVFWNITPADASEFERISGTVTMLDGQSDASITLKALDDDVPEVRRVYQLTVSSATPGLDISPSARHATVTMAASDHPHGRFSFSQRQIAVMEEEGGVNVTVVRSLGSLGDVAVSYETSGGSALSGLDFPAASGRLLFAPGQTSRDVLLRVFDDVLPEGPEEFHLNITGVEMLNVSGVDYTVRESGLQLDLPPTVGNISSVAVVILKNDNAEGILEFPPDHLDITVEEDAGYLVIPVLRAAGLYGQVSAEYFSRGLTATPDLDYFLANGSVTFSHGQNANHINITILDDLDSESAETFEVLLSRATGGAVLGLNSVARVTIAKSDSLSGVVRFLNESLITLVNPNSTLTLTLVLERAGGFVGNATVAWRVLGPNSREPLPPLNEDFGEPVNGSFDFGDGEDPAERTIRLSLLPHGEVEVEEVFTVELSILSGTMDVDPRSGSVQLRIEKFGDPNGIVQFAEAALVERLYNEPTEDQGPLNISLLLKRREGVMGNITIHWEIRSEWDLAGDFLSAAGAVVILEGQREALLLLSLMPDSVPELEELYLVELTGVEGGATLDGNPNRTSARIRVRANDEPHGVFSLDPGRQGMATTAAGPGAEPGRFILLNVTRLAGLFGNASVGYRVGGGPVVQSLLGDRAEGRVLLVEGESSASITLWLSNQVFLSAGENFTLELTDVRLVSPLLSTPPRLAMGSTVATVTAVEEAANTEVGFASLALQVFNLETGRCEARVTRTGLFGGVTVNWSGGYPPGLAQPGFTLGAISPTTGSVTLAHGERSKPIALSALWDASEPAAFAIRLTAASPSANATAAVRLRPGFTVAEVEPLGVYRFSRESRQVAVEEDVQNVTLYVQRLYGARSNRSRLSYATVPGSAAAGEDFGAVADGWVTFDSPHQTNASLRLTIVNDTLAEPDEHFYVNLTDVRILVPDVAPAPDARPRLAPGQSVARVTIRANNATGEGGGEGEGGGGEEEGGGGEEEGGGGEGEGGGGEGEGEGEGEGGLLSIGPGLVHTEEDREQGGQQERRVELRVRRAVGLDSPVSVRVRAYGGGTTVSSPLPFALEHDGTLAREGQDFQLVSSVVSLQAGQSEAAVVLLILDDQEPEGQEAFFVYLSDPEGGVQITDQPDQQGYGAFAKIIILGSDFHNGIMGFALGSLAGQTLDEDSANRTAVLVLQRQENRVFEDVQVYWRATFSAAAPVLVSNGVNLTRELLDTAGAVVCRRGQTHCLLTVEVRADEDPEGRSWFLVEIYQVGAGASINQTARFANVTLVESDDPSGLIYFAAGSRLPVATLKTTQLALQVYRQASTTAVMSVRYRMLELPRPEAVGRSMIWPAIAGQDFLRQEGSLTFDRGESSASLLVTLTPDRASSKPYPKRFRVELYGAAGGARVLPEFAVANVTLVTDAASAAVWALLDQLQQRPLDPAIIDRVLQGLINKVTELLSPEQTVAVLEALGKVLAEAEGNPLQESSRGLTYDLLCAMANPSQRDTRGLSQLAEVAERFAFSLLTQSQCGEPGQRGLNILDTCPYLSISAFHWYPTQINDYVFTGRNADTFRLPGALLAVPPPTAGSLAPSACRKLQLTEYTTDHWFLTGDKTLALNGKVFSVSLQGRGSQPLADGNKVVYRIHTSGPRVQAGRSRCLLWNQGAESWLSEDQVCWVVEDAGNYVECACSHLSVYTAQATMGSSYNEAFYASGFICISGFALAIVSHLLCSRFPMFAAKLLTHMMLGCLGTQLAITPGEEGGGDLVLH
ncbi:G-protein coupled receptor 98 [Merluccius polli]|uniref:Adhesion G-protein coupled receptor V1 n=1 Tax=Merluccius polli TaxID=89951 RepID=A0AA47PCS9_MERPO|nr:G-protein coupled receptor 98 [Merluccius polli]